MIRNIYLNFYERISQIYMHHWCIVIALVMIKIYLFKRSIVNNLNNLQEYSDDLCIYLNKSSATLNTLPSSISDVINSLVIQNLNQLQYSWLKVLDLIISITENLIVFFIEIFIGTFTCLLTALISGTVDFALDSTESVIVAVNDTVVEISKDIQDGLTGLSSIINSLLSVIGKIESFFSGDKYNPKEYENKIDLSINALSNLSIPSSVLSNINNFKKEVPDFNSLENSTLKLIKEPFRSVSNEISKSTYFTSNVSIEEIPTFEDFQSTNFCGNSSDIDTQIKSLVKIVSGVSKIILIILSIILLFTLIGIFFLELYSWKKTLKIQKSLQETENTGNTIAIYQNPVLYIAYKFGLLNTTGNWGRFSWFINYCTSPYAIGILILALIGFFTILLQFIIISKLRSSIDVNETTTAIEELFKNDSVTYINKVNKFLSEREVDINKELFGNLKNTTSSLNSTINDFLVGFNESVSDVFEGTVFKTPISTVFYCVIGRKLIMVEKGLTWINKNLVISIPTISEDTISSNFNISESSNNITDYINKKLNDIIDYYKGVIWFEFLISLCLFCLWVLQLIIGALILLYKGYNERTIAPHHMPPPVYQISSPKPLTIEEQQNYAYPYTNLHSQGEECASSNYSDSMKEK